MSEPRARAGWRTSSYSTNGGECVECAVLDESAALRDSKHPHDGHLSFTRTEWAAFLTAVKHSALGA
ncbi:hypothetical protein LP52_15860 [Streptomonospora alba]|uniref:DUF397 domain-containing protein n=1 Tax=Streptomonospora alba TaxID=183763 RepID=A0A0C2JGF1_9ACTN|nr:DUF397 domain-containing protein [Streptomonospora alba]KIH97995.1 hypothetical protein LP52_15860 [Streptomonospora alba]